MPNNLHATHAKMRVDKWLWVARFFKTRSLAKTAIESGKVQIQGQKIKTSRLISIGEILSIRQGNVGHLHAKQVQVLALADMRKDATFAQTLYQESDESIARRASAQAMSLTDNLARPHTKPTKKQRRALHEFLHNHDLAHD